MYYPVNPGVHVCNVMTTCVVCKRFMFCLMCASVTFLCVLMCVMLNTVRLFCLCVLCSVKEWNGCAGCYVFV